MPRWRDVKKGKHLKDNQTEVKDTIPFASLPQRFKAFITDTFMILMPLMYIVFYLVMGSREEFAEDRTMGWLYIFIPHMIITVALWVRSGQTPGKKAYNVKLVNTNLELISIPQAIFRYLLITVSLITIIGLFFPLFRKDSRTIHDLLSKTIVINTK